MAFRNPVRSIPADRIIGRINGTTQIEPGSITTPSLAAGSITTDLLAANAIDGQTITGAVIRTAATGRRVLLSNDAGGLDTPGIAMYSGHPDELNPGFLGADTITVASTLQPVAQLLAPQADNGTALMELISPAGTRHGNFELTANSSRPYCYVSGRGGTDDDPSTVELFAQDGSAGGASAVLVQGHRLFMRHRLASFTIDGDDFTATLENAALVGSDARFTGAVSKSGATWETPAFGATWAAGNNLGGNSPFSGMKFRHTAEDEVWVHGTAVSSGTGSIIFTLPAAYRPPVRHVLPCYFSSGGGTPHAGWAQVTEAGAVAVNSTISGWTVASGTQVFINGKFPMGNLA